MKRFFPCLLVVTGLANTAYGHHSRTWHFDIDAEITIEGVVKEYQFVNPHSRLFVDAIDDDGNTVTWDCDLINAAAATRYGWTKDVFEPGQRIVITANPPIRNENECFYISGVLEDGRRIARVERFPEEAPTDSAEAAGEARVVDGSIPSLSRTWGAVIRDNPGGGGGPPLPGEPNRRAAVLSEAGRRALEAYDPITDDPSLQCKPISIARLWGHGSPMQIREEEDVVLIHHEFMDARRTVHLDQSEHPQNLTHSALGHSIGRYEGSTLVIDTVGYEAGVLYQFPGLPHSNQLHTVERLTPSDDGQVIEISWVADDSAYFTDVVTGSLRRGVTTDPVGEYNCVHPDAPGEG
jgi:hypothetical protein